MTNQSSLKINFEWKIGVNSHVANGSNGSNGSPDVAIGYNSYIHSLINNKLIRVFLTMADLGKSVRCVRSVRRVFFPRWMQKNGKIFFITDES